MAQSGNKAYTESELGHIRYIKHDIIRNIPVPAGCRILVLTANHKTVEIRTWNEASIRLVNTVTIDSNELAGLTDVQLAKQFHLRTNADQDSVVIDLGYPAASNANILVAGKGSSITGSQGGRADTREATGMQGTQPGPRGKSITIKGSPSVRRNDSAFGLTGSSRTLLGEADGPGGSDEPRGFSLFGVKHVYTTQDIQRIAETEPTRGEAILFIPNGMALRMAAKSSIVKGMTNLSRVTLEADHSWLYFTNVDTLKSHSAFSDICTRNIILADVNIQNGNFIASNIDMLVIRSKMSRIDSKRIGSLTVEASNDDSYLIDDLDLIKGKKEYGSFRAGILHKSADLDCSSSDIIVKEISSTVESLTIHDSYASIHLGFAGFDNLDLWIQGASSTISVPSAVELSAGEDQHSAADLHFKSSPPTALRRATGVRIDCIACLVNLQ